MSTRQFIITLSEEELYTLCRILNVFEGEHENSSIIRTGEFNLLTQAIEDREEKSAS